MSPESFSRWFKQAEGRISKLEDSSTEIIQSEQKGKNEEKIK